MLSINDKTPFSLPLRQYTGEIAGIYRGSSWFGQGNYNIETVVWDGEMMYTYPIPETWFRTGAELADGQTFVMFQVGDPHDYPYCFLFEDPYDPPTEEELMLWQDEYAYFEGSGL